MSDVRASEPGVRCACGHNQARHEYAGFDGECVGDGCRCTEYRPRMPEPVPASPASRYQTGQQFARRIGAGPAHPATSVEALVAAARDTGDKRALLVIGRIQSMADELRHLVAAHRANLAAQAARERDEQYKAQLAATPKRPRKADKPKATNRITDGAYPCPACSYVAKAPQGLAAHRRNAHEQREVVCPGCGQTKKATGLAIHRARFCAGTPTEAGAA